MSGANFEVVEEHFGAVLVIRSLVFEDERGYFYEAWRDSLASDSRIPGRFVQDNHSRSRRNVIRGLHWQGPPAPQGKLVRCTSGKVMDVVVDLRGGSPSFGQFREILLEAPRLRTGSPQAPAGSQRLLYVPPGFAHGFVTLSDEADVEYKVTAPWNREAEGTLAYDDPEVGIPWGRWMGPSAEAVVSAKDREGRSLRAIRENPPFRYEGRR